MLFCDGDYYFIFKLLRGFIIFSEVSGLLVNKSKSEIYKSNVDQDVIIKITEVSGF